MRTPALSVCLMQQFSLLEMSLMLATAVAICCFCRRVVNVSNLKSCSDWRDLFRVSDIELKRLACQVIL